MRRAARRLAAVLLAAVLLVAAAGVAAAEGPPARVVVLGAGAEAAAAAVAAAEVGAQVTLLPGRTPLGGTLGPVGLALIDDATHDGRPLQGGLFARWRERVGGGPTFDPRAGAAAWRALLDGAGVDVVATDGPVAIEVEGGAVAGVAWDGGRVPADAVIDGDGEVRHARAVGAQADVGWRAWGVDDRMADGWIVRLDGVDLAAVRAAARARGPGWAQVEGAAAWGAFGRAFASFDPGVPGVRLRGANLAVGADGTAWLNALVLAPGTLEGVPGDVGRVATLAPEARRAAEERLRGRLEAALAALPAHLAPRVPGIAPDAGVALAPQPYRRETVHLRAACTLRGADVLAHRSGPLDVAVGGYPLDVQATRDAPDGLVIADPARYGVPLCVAAPADGASGVWVVGRGVGVDPVAYASARVAPLGVALGEAVGVAATRAVRAGRTPRTASRDAAFVAGVRRTLAARGAVLPAPPDPPPVAADAPHGAAFRAVAAYALASAGYANAPDGGAPTTCVAVRRQVAAVLRRAAGEAEAAERLERAVPCTPGGATAADAARVQRAAACLVWGACAGPATPEALRSEGAWPTGLPDAGPLSRGQGWALAATWLPARAP